MLSIFSLWKWVESRADEGAIPREMTSQMTYEVIQSYPHDSAAFTQGLIYEDGIFMRAPACMGVISAPVDVATGEV